jgi:uncharacterized protein YraI
MDGSSWPAATVAVNLHSGSSINCPKLAAAQVGDHLDYYCYTKNYSSGYTWTYLRDNRTGAKGWARDDNLPGDGSFVWCGF